MRGWKIQGLPANGRKAVVIASLLALMALGSDQAVAQASKSAPLPQLIANGEALALKLCAQCHLVPGTTPAAIPAGIPTMRAIANRQGQTGKNIEKTLLDPHPPMPDIKLSYDEIRDIVLFLDTLRAEGQPSLSTPPAGSEPSPRYPRPS